MSTSHSLIGKLEEQTDQSLVRTAIAENWFDFTAITSMHFCRTSASTDSEN